MEGRVGRVMVAAVAIARWSQLWWLWRAGLEVELGTEGGERCSGWVSGGLSRENGHVDTFGRGVGCMEEEADGHDQMASFLVWPRKDLVARR